MVSLPFQISGCGPAIIGVGSYNKLRHPYSYTLGYIIIIVMPEPDLLPMPAMLTCNIPNTLVHIIMQHLNPMGSLQTLA